MKVSRCGRSDEHVEPQRVVIAIGAWCVVVPQLRGVVFAAVGKVLYSDVLRLRLG